MTVWQDRKTGKWRFKCQHQGKRLEGKGYRIRAEAKEAERIKLDWFKADLREKQKRINMVYFGALAETYLDDCADRMQANTVRQKAFVIRSFIAFLGADMPVNEISQETFLAYLRGRRTEGKATANRDLRDLKALYNWAIDREIKGITKNPLAKIPKWSEDPYVKYVPPIEDIHKVRLVASRDERDFVDTIFYGFGRRIEPVRLTWEDINFDRMEIRFLTRKRRGGQLEEVIKPMTQSLCDILKSRWTRRDKSSPYVFQFRQTDLDHMMQKLCAKAGVKAFGFHSIRHYVASQVQDLRAAQLLLGHKRITTTEIYHHTISDALRSAAEVLDEKEKFKVAPEVVTLVKK